MSSINQYLKFQGVTSAAKRRSVLLSFIIHLQVWIHLFTNTGTDFLPEITPGAGSELIETVICGLQELTDGGSALLT